jgi:hypothetical protein
MYAPVPNAAVINAPAPSNSTGIRCPIRFGFTFFMFVALVITLAVTYESCVLCVLGVAIVSLMCMQAAPMMPLVFIASVVILLYHTVDYHKATVRVEVPLSDLVYVPTYDDFQKYVHMTSDPPTKINGDVTAT